MIIIITIMYFIYAITCIDRCSWQSALAQPSSSSMCSQPSTIQCQVGAIVMINDKDEDDDEDDDEDEDDDDDD